MIEYTLSKKDMMELLVAHSLGVPMINAVWQKLGDRHGFDWRTVEQKTPGMVDANNPLVILAKENP